MSEEKRTIEVPYEEFSILMSNTKAMLIQMSMQHPEMLLIMTEEKFDELIDEFLKKMCPTSAEIYIKNEDEMLSIAEAKQEEIRKTNIEELIKKTLEDDDDQV